MTAVGSDQATAGHGVCFCAQDRRNSRSH